MLLGYVAFPWYPGLPTLRPKAKFHRQSPPAQHETDRYYDRCKVLAPDQEFHFSCIRFIFRMCSQLAAIEQVSDLSTNKTDMADLNVLPVTAQWSNCHLHFGQHRVRFYVFSCCSPPRSSGKFISAPCLSKVHERRDECLTTVHHTE